MIMNIICSPGGYFIVDDTEPLKFMCKLDNKTHKYVCGKESIHTTTTTRSSMLGH